MWSGARTRRLLSVPSPGEEVARVENLVVTNTDNIDSGLDVLNEVLVDRQNESRAA